MIERRSTSGEAVCDLAAPAPLAAFVCEAEPVASATSDDAGCAGVTALRADAADGIAPAAEDCATGAGDGAPLASAGNVAKIDTTVSSETIADAPTRRYALPGRIAARRRAAVRCQRMITMVPVSRMKESSSTQAESRKV